MYKQVVMTAFGGPEVLVDSETLRVGLSPNKLRIKVKAVSVNPIDAKIRQGTSFVCKLRQSKPFPWGLGFDAAGEVIETYAGSSFKVGDRVAGSVGIPADPAAYAEEAILAQEHCIHLSDEISFEQGAALITAGLTALSISKMFKNEKKILVAGGSGGVGHLLVQYLKHSGFEVSASCSAASRQLVLRYIDDCFDYQDDLVAKLGQSFDAVVDMVGEAVGKGLYALLKKDGLLVTVPTITEDMLKASCPKDKRCEGVRCQRTPEYYQELLKLAQQGCLPYISATFPLNAQGARQAHKQIESTHTQGKIVLIS